MITKATPLLVQVILIGKRNKDSVTYLKIKRITMIKDWELQEQKEENIPPRKQTQIWIPQNEAPNKGMNQEKVELLQESKVSHPYA